MKLKTPIAKAHPEEIRTGFNGAISANYTWLWITIAIILIAALGYYFYKKNQDEKESKKTVLKFDENGMPIIEAHLV